MYLSTRGVVISQSQVNCIVHEEQLKGSLRYIFFSSFRVTLLWENIFFLIEELVNYYTELVSGVQHSDSVIHMYIYFQFFSIICYYRTLNII